MKEITEVFKKNSKNYGIEVVDDGVMEIDDLTVKNIKDTIKAKKANDSSVLNREQLWRSYFSELYESLEKNKHGDIGDETEKKHPNFKESTVLYYAERDGIKYFVVSDAVGTQDILSEQDLIELVKKGTALFGCEVDSSNGRDYIKVGGNVKKICDDYILRYEGYGNINVIIVNPFIKSVKIPGEIDGVRINYIESIKVVPSSKNIEELILEPYGYIYNSALKEFKHLKRLELRFKVHGISVRDSVVKDCKDLEYIYINGSVGSEAFKDCKNLKKVELGPYAVIIAISAFLNCTSLEEVNMENSNIMGIMGLAFGNCQSLRKVTFPETLKTLSSTAFWRCPNIREVEFKGPFYIVESKCFIDEFDGTLYEDAVKDGNFDRLFDRDNEVVVRCIGNFPTRYLKNHMGHNVRIVEVCNDEKLNDMKKKFEARQNVFEFRPAAYDLSRSNYEIAECLKMMSDEEFKEKLLNELVSYFNYLKLQKLADNVVNLRSGVDAIFNIIDVYPYYINVDFQPICYNVEIDEVVKVGIFKDYIVFGNIVDEGEVVLEIVCISREKIIKSLESGKICTNIDDLESKVDNALMLPTYEIFMDDENIKVYEKDGKVIIECLDSGNVKTIEFTGDNWIVN